MKAGFLDHVETCQVSLPFGYRRVPILAGFRGRRRLAKDSIMFVARFQKLCETERRTRVVRRIQERNHAHVLFANRLGDVVKRGNDLLTGLKERAAGPIYSVRDYDNGHSAQCKSKE